MHFRDIFENSLYKDDTEKQVIVGDSKILASTFWINWLGFICLYMIKSEIEPKVKQYFKSDKKLKIDAIADDNNDSSLVLSLMKSNIKDTTIKKMTKLLVLMRQGVKLDEQKFKDELLVLVYKDIFHSIKAFPKINEIVTGYKKGVIDAEEVVMIFARIARKRKLGEEFRILVRKCKISPTSDALKNINLKAKGGVIPTPQTVTPVPTPATNNAPAITQTSIDNSSIDTVATLASIKMKSEAKKKKIDKNAHIKYLEKYKLDHFSGPITSVIDCIIKFHKAKTSLAIERHFDLSRLNDRIFIKGLLELEADASFIKQLARPDLFDKKKIFNGVQPAANLLYFWFKEVDYTDLEGYQKISYIRHLVAWQNEQNNDAFFNKHIELMLNSYINSKLLDNVLDLFVSLLNTSKNIFVLKTFKTQILLTIINAAKADKVPNNFQHFLKMLKSKITPEFEKEMASNKFVIEALKKTENYQMFFKQDIKDVKLDCSAAILDILNGYKSWGDQNLPNYSLSERDFIILNNLPTSKIFTLGTANISYVLGTVDLKGIFKHFKKDQRIYDYILRVILHYITDVDSENKSKYRKSSYYEVLLRFYKLHHHKDITEKMLVEALANNISASVAFDNFSIIEKALMKIYNNPGKYYFDFKSAINVNTIGGENSERFIKLHAELWMDSIFPTSEDSKDRYLGNDFKHHIPNSFGAGINALTKEQISDFRKKYNKLFDEIKSSLEPGTRKYIEFNNATFSSKENKDQFNNIMLNELISDSKYDSKSVQNFWKNIDKESLDFDELTSNLSFKNQSPETIKIIFDIASKSNVGNLDRHPQFYKNAKTEDLKEFLTKKGKINNESFGLDFRVGTKSYMNEVFEPLLKMQNILDVEMQITTLRNVIYIQKSYYSDFSFKRFGVEDIILSYSYEIFKKSPDHFDKLLDKLETKEAKKIVKGMKKWLSIGQLLGDIHKSPIVPLEKLSAEDVKNALKFNNFELDEAAVKIRKKKNETYSENLKNLDDAAKTLSSAVPDQQIKKVEISEKELAKKSYEMNKKYHAGRHGSIGLQILEEYDVHLKMGDWDKFREEWGGANGILKPAFHGTNALAASMIMRFGFAILSPSELAAAGGKYAGSMLGAGIYSAPNMDKIANYVGDQNYGRLGSIGYFFEMDETLGEKNKHYRAAGLGGDGIRSSEYCAKYPREQIKILKCYKAAKSSLKFISIEAKQLGVELDESFENDIWGKDIIMESESYENQETKEEDGLFTFIFMDYYVPYKRHEAELIDNIEFDDDEIQVSSCQDGLSITIPNKVGKFEMFKIADTFEAMYDNNPFITKFLSLVKDKVRYIPNDEI